MNNDLTKLARWIIPGWLALLAFFGFVAIDIVFYVPGKPPLYSSISEFLQSLSISNGLVEGLLLAASGVPLGFIIYQLYFFLRWNSLFSRDGLFSPILPGRMDELDEIQKDIEVQEMTYEFDWRVKWVSDPFYKRDHGFRSRYMELFFLEAAQKIDTKFSGLQVYNRYLYLHEIMHTLGASVLSLYLGFSGYAFLKLHKNNLPIIDYFFYTMIIVGIFFFLVNYEYKQKDNAKKGKMSDLQDTDLVPTFRMRIKGLSICIVSPAALFVFSLLLMHLWANPLLTEAGSSVALSIFFRGVVSAILILTWFISKNKAGKIGDLLVFFVVLVVSVIFLKIFAFASRIDWSYFVGLVVFLIGNMILFYNRQNTKEQSFALQYYTMRRYVTERQHEN